MNLPLVEGKRFLKVADCTSAVVVIQADTDISIFTNRGAGAAVQFTLPTAQVGMEFTFVGMAAQNIVLKPATGETVSLAGTSQSANTAITGTGAQNLVCRLTCLVAGGWKDTIQRGTWA